MLCHCFPFDVKFEEQYPEIQQCYGVCDNIEQIFKKCPEIQDKNRRFCISINPILRENQSQEGGWRWHKWGPYIGKHDIQCEYLADEDLSDIDQKYVVVFHIFEFKDEK